MLPPALGVDVALLVLESPWFGAAVVLEPAFENGSVVFGAVAGFATVPAPLPELMPLPELVPVPELVPLPTLVPLPEVVPLPTLVPVPVPVPVVDPVPVLGALCVEEPV